MIVYGNHIIADEDKVFRRKNTEEIFGSEIFLGYSHYINGVLQSPPHLDVAEDFEEIDPPEEVEDYEIPDNIALSIIMGNEI
jgi:hypothetical protein